MDVGLIVFLSSTYYKIKSNSDELLKGMHMIRLLALCLFLAGSAQAALPEASRQSLSGFNGIAFGTPFSVAEQKLGPSFKAKTAPRDPKIRMLLGHAAAFGENFGVNYSFERALRMTNVYAIASIKTGDFASCKVHWTTVLSGLIDTYGQPDSDVNDLDATTMPSEFVTYNFKDGAIIEASLLGCLLMVNYSARATAP